jgi:hypothetical protein
MAHIPAIANVGRTVRRYPLASAETPLEGAAVYLVTGEVTICGADPSVVLGFMLHDYPGALEIDPYNGDVLVLVAKSDSTFWLTGSTDPTDLSAIGSSFGVAHEATTEVTYVDLTETSTNLVVDIVDVDLSRLMFECTIVDAVRQLNA